MINFADLFSWDRFITPSIIRIFYWLVVITVVLAGLSGIFTGLVTMAVNFMAGLFAVIGSILMVLLGILGARISAELVMIIFRINEHLAAIRERGGM